MKMKPRKPVQKTDPGKGMLPASAPLANPYVPFQPSDPPQYEARKALIRGTLYPGLDLPFMGMVNEELKPDTMLSQLQSLSFAIEELALYLDTHRDDKEALAVYQAYQNMYYNAKLQYVQVCGPLNHMSPTEGEYRWLDDPWPWEYCANQEG